VTGSTLSPGAIFTDSYHHYLNRIPGQTDINDMSHLHLASNEGKFEFYIPVRDKAGSNRVRGSLTTASLGERQSLGCRMPSDSSVQLAR
jgi:hypothetical protein